MKKRSVRGRLVALMAFSILGASLHAQDADPLAKLGAPTRQAIQSLVDTARTEGLPAQMLISTAQEGISKHADEARIVLVVRTNFLALREARVALGPDAKRDELIAGAHAVMAKISETDIIELRQARRGKSIEVPLVVLADLVTRGVPVDTASRAILALSMGGAGDADLLGLSHRVQQDILSGAKPADAVMQRVREIPVKVPLARVP